MGAPDILGRLQSLGLILSADGDTLRAEPKAAITSEVRALIRKNKPEILSLIKARSEAPSWGWVMRYPDGTAIEVYVVPEQTRAEMLRDYPGSISAEPLPLKGSAAMNAQQAGDAKIVF